MINRWPAPIFEAFSFASSINSSSLPVNLINLGPEDSLKAIPNLIEGEFVTNASYKSSTLFIKWDCPMITLYSFGFLIL